MQDTERLAHISELMKNFYNNMESIMRQPLATNQNDGIKLLNEVNTILEEFDKLENPQSMARYKIQFELVKRRLQQAMMTSPEE